MKQINRAFIVGLCLNLIFVIIEAASGFYYHSLALLSDAGHNLGDVASLVLALLAYRLAKVKPDSKYTYGYRKTTVLVSLLNAVILLIAIGGIVWESIERFQEPVASNGKSIAIIAGVGIFINAFTAWLFLKDKDKDLNIEGAYLHMAADALVSVGVLVAGILIFYTGWYWIDGAISVLIAIVILFSTINLLKNSFNLSIDAVPLGIDIANVQKEIEKINGVKDVHHIHIWAISTTLNAFTAHIRLLNDVNCKDMVKIKSLIRHKLIHQNIQHSTIEFEWDEENCVQEHDGV
jgi:cobalt-zinc-cadmium efflux system protein